jgi:hypothetical protein
LDLRRQRIHRGPGQHQYADVVHDDGDGRQDESRQDAPREHAQHETKRDRQDRPFEREDVVHQINELLFHLRSHQRRAAYRSCPATPPDIVTNFARRRAPKLPRRSSRQV